MSNDLQAWLDSLKPGDAVAVHEFHGRSAPVYTTTVARRTPSGRIVCEGESVFTKEGYLYGNPVYKHRCLRPV